MHPRLNSQGGELGVLSGPKKERRFKPPLFCTDTFTAIATSDHPWDTILSRRSEHSQSYP